MKRLKFWRRKRNTQHPDVGYWDFMMRIADNHPELISADQSYEPPSKAMRASPNPGSGTP